MTTSVVIATHSFERSEHLARAVASALNQQPRPHEVVVSVDNNPELYLWVREQFPEVVPVHNQGMGGASIMSFSNSA